MLLDPTIPEEGGMIGHPGSLDGRTTKEKTCWNVIKDRYGKPVLIPFCGADVTESGCPGMVKIIEDVRDGGTYSTERDDA